MGDPEVKDVLCVEVGISQLAGRAKVWGGCRQLCSASVWLLGRSRLGAWVCIQDWDQIPDAAWAPPCRSQCPRSMRLGHPGE